MKRDLRIVFMGTPDFAVESLRAIIETGFNLVGVVTAPDRPAGRGLKLQMSAVKKFAIEKNIPVLQPTKLKSRKFIQELEALNHNVQVIVAFRILPQIVFEMPEYGSFNLHGSLLPQYRGAAPINWAVINGETISGVTTFFLKPKVDTGNIILQQEVAIEEADTAGDLHDRLMIEGGKLVVETIRQIESDDVNEVEQPHIENLKPAPKIFREDCEINWNQPVEQVYNFIRGLSPYPTAWTTIQGKSLKIYQSDFIIEKHNFPNGKIISDNKTELKFAALGGFILCKEVQLQGKRKMSVEEFLRGFKVEN